ncbi:recombinase family protein [Tunturibacter psychrotolerans]|uniref:Recombinase family protein n=1 Tax=Tunturiibacter psychrotolerans TaxID=3069686 RepID=A0AAU7ZN10_9BACT
MSNLLLTMLGAVAQFERELIKKRQREVIALAKAKGNVYQRRMPSLTKEKMALLRSRVKAGEGKTTLAKEFGISRASVDNYIAGEKC